MNMVKIEPISLFRFTIQITTLVFLTGLTVNIVKKEDYRNIKKIKMKKFNTLKF